MKAYIHYESQSTDTAPAHTYKATLEDDTRIDELLEVRPSPPRVSVKVRV
jgi:hypothetical protein